MPISEDMWDSGVGNSAIVKAILDFLDGNLQKGFSVNEIYQAVAEEINKIAGEEVVFNAKCVLDQLAANNKIESKMILINNNQHEHYRSLYRNGVVVGSSID